MIWWATQPSRALAERAAIAELQERSSWLSKVEWRFNNALTAFVDFELNVDEKRFACTLTYPEFFPDAPPSVAPVAEVRLSSHQYGAGGELCLEFRADNWRPEITGAMMIESAFRLITNESDQEAPPVPSAHATTIGQEIRSSSLRFLLSPSAHAFMTSLPASMVLDGAVVEHCYGDTWVACPLRLGEKEAPVWAEPPSLAIGTSEGKAKFVRVADGWELPATFTAASLDASLEAHDASDWIEQAKAEWLPFTLVATRDQVRLVLLVGGADKRKVLEYRALDLPASAARLPEQYAALAEKRVGIVGCGSVGSKIAASLARSGVRSFLLVDTDILFPGNLVRNELDARGVGVGKAKALKQHLREIHGDCDVVVRELLFGGQESSGSTSSVMSALGDCSLVIDATASADVFNLCAAVCRVKRIPLVWGVVFGGGVGGLIARARPDLDPVPHAARDQVGRWYAERGIPWELHEHGEYGAESAGAPLIASDSDVAVIAAHLTRFAIDALLNPAPSSFPCSAYAIGLATHWIFTAPFDTWPIELTPEGKWGVQPEENASEQLDRFLQAALPRNNGDEA